MAIESSPNHWWFVRFALCVQVSTFMETMELWVCVLFVLLVTSYASFLCLCSSGRVAELWNGWFNGFCDDRKMLQAWTTMNGSLLGLRTSIIFKKS